MTKVVASIRVVLANKTSARNAVYFISARIHWFAETASPLRAGIGARSWPLCGSQAALCDQASHPACSVQNVPTAYSLSRNNRQNP
jgi:hypothetical protein